MKRIAQEQVIKEMIYIIRAQKVMFDSDLASLYGVETKQLKRAVRRNTNRFPKDFMFKLTKKEYKTLRCQFGTSKFELDNLKSQIATSSWGGHRYQPFVFTEQGVAMLSSVLNSDKAIQVNIAIMRTFTKLRSMVIAHEGLKKKIEEMEEKYDKQFKVVFTALKQLLEPPKKEKGKVGFHP